MTAGTSRVESPLIGARIKALREQRELTQDSVARLFGFKDRQTVSAIETGDRGVTAEELLLAVEKLGAPLEYFTDPFLLAGEGRFSWRHTGVDAERLAAYEHNSGRWIAAFKRLAPAVGRETPFMRRALGLTRRSRFEDAMRAGERFAVEFELGDVPAARLSQSMERQLGILVLMIDAEHDISGAACRLPELDAVLIARREVAGRRHFDLAHELFHILTWDAMPPEHSEAAQETGGNRVEQLANNFAAAVLMPSASLRRFGGWADLAAEELIRRLNAAADELQVTSSALRWRLVALGELKPAAARALPEAALRNNGRAEADDVSPAPVFRAVHGGDGVGHRSRPRLGTAHGRPAGRYGRRARGTVRIARCPTACRSLTVVARHTGAVLVDTNIILESYRVGSWRALAGGYGVHTVEECVDETQAGSQRREPERRIDEVELRGSLAVGHSVGPKERAELAIRTQDIALDPGEASLWAHARSRDDRTTRRS